jgi:hypothetical protein
MYIQRDATILSWFLFQDLYMFRAFTMPIIMCTIIECMYTVETQQKIPYNTNCISLRFGGRLERFDPFVGSSSDLIKTLSDLHQYFSAKRDPVWFTLW